MSLSALVFLALLETAPKVPAAPAPEDKSERVMKAIPVEDPTKPSGTKKTRETQPAGPKNVFSQCKVEGNVIALTFDDGPHPQNTPRLLDMLKESNIKCTFFLIGKSASTWPAVVKRIVEEGHEVANHTWDHKQLNLMKDTRAIDELQRTHDAIVNACGTAPVLYRPPYGAIKVAQRAMIMEKLHYPTILWDIDTQDWRSPRTVTKVHDSILKNAHPGAIILCHDIHQPTIDAMPSTLDDLIAKGFQFRTVSQLIKMEADAAAAPKPEPAPPAVAAPSPPATPPAEATVKPQAQ